jgi:hypothetical protein
MARVKELQARSFQLRNHNVHGAKSKNQGNDQRADAPLLKVRLPDPKDNGLLQKQSKAS